MSWNVEVANEAGEVPLVGGVVAQVLQIGRFELSQLLRQVGIRRRA